MKKGDRVSIYMPMVVEATIAMLACARIGAVHSVVFGGFSAEALADRIVDSNCKTLITANGTFRGAKAIPMKPNADQAMDQCIQSNGGRCGDMYCGPQGREKKSGIECSMTDGRDLWWDEVMEEPRQDVPCEEMDAEDPLFILVYFRVPPESPKEFCIQLPVTWFIPRPRTNIFSIITRKMFIFVLRISVG